MLAIGTAPTWPFLHRVTMSAVGARLIAGKGG